MQHKYISICQERKPMVKEYFHLYIFDILVDILEMPYSRMTEKLIREKQQIC